MSDDKGRAAAPLEDAIVRKPNGYKSARAYTIVFHDDDGPVITFDLVKREITPHRNIGEVAERFWADMRKLTEETGQQHVFMSLADTQQIVVDVNMVTGGVTLSGCDSVSAGIIEQLRHRFGGA